MQAVRPKPSYKAVEEEEIQPLIIPPLAVEECEGEAMPNQMFSMERKPEAFSLKLNGDLSEVAAYPSLDVYDHKPNRSEEKMGSPDQIVYVYRDAIEP